LNVHLACRDRWFADPRENVECADAHGGGESVENAAAVVQLLQGA